MIKINLEKELLKQSKKLNTPEELLIIKEYDKHTNVVDNDALERIGLNANIKKGREIAWLNNRKKKETSQFKQERVFHISQIENICMKYYLKFLPSHLYNGIIDEELPNKISLFEIANNVECKKETKLYYNMCQKVVKGNTYIMAPKESFILKEKPKDPLLFYQINDEYYYLIHKWGDDLTLLRRMKSIFSGRIVFWLVMLLLPLAMILLYNICPNNTTAGLALFSIPLYLVTLLVESTELSNWWGGFYFLKKNNPFNDFND